MKKLLAIVKANPVIVGCVLVALVSLGAVGYAAWVASDQSAAMTERGKLLTKIEGYSKTQVRLPPETPGGEQKIVPTVVNDDVNKKLQETYSLLQRQRDDVMRFAVDRNHADHELISNKLFPEEGEKPSNFEYITIKGDLRKKLGGMLGSGPADGALPRLGAGMKPSEKELEDALAFARAQYIRDKFPRKFEQLSVKEHDELRAKQSDRVMRLLEGRANSIHLYVAQTNAEMAGFPLTLPTWTLEKTPEERKYRPTMTEWWYGQSDLWVIQDVLRAIALANNADDRRANVTNSPIKRLISLQVLPGYVGFESTASAVARTDDATGGAVSAGGPPPVAPQGRQGGGPSWRDTSRVKLDYSASTTGRISNPVYDVRHVKVEMIVDYNRLPEVFAAVAQVNFMTVLRMTQVKDVDEYAEMKNGYFYGEGDCVSVELLVETVWFRQWTAGTKDNPGPMPKKVRDSLIVGF